MTSNVFCSRTHLPHAHAPWSPDVSPFTICGLDEGQSFTKSVHLLKHALPAMRSGPPRLSFTQTRTDIHTWSEIDTRSHTRVIFLRGSPA